MPARLREPQERLSAFFSGHVQGVGFRFTVLEVAERFPSVSGVVRNLPDGRVEMQAEGAREELDNFLEAVRQRMRAYISDTAVSRRPATGEFSGFDISR